MPKNRSTLDSRFARYVLIAGAAAAATRPVKASVVYTVEPVPIDFSNGTHSIDLNGDGIEDFFFTGGPLEVMGNSVSWFTSVSTSLSSTALYSSSFTYSFSYGPTQATSSSSGTATSAVTETYSYSVPVFSTERGFDEIALFGTDAEAFGTGAVIGSGITSWAVSAPMPAFTSPGVAFLGLEFYDTAGNLYYGFAQFDPDNLVGFAFDNVPDTSITTFDVTSIPEPGSLATLALGAAAMELIRRKRSRQ